MLSISSSTLDLHAGIDHRCRISCWLRPDMCRYHRAWRGNWLAQLEVTAQVRAYVPAQPVTECLA